jgi:hypothetical protein
VAEARNSFLDAALAYAERGWYVHPLIPGTKIPATEHGFKDATTDPAVIREWWIDEPDANIGVSCGPSALFVIDLDIKSDLATGIVKDGIGAWKTLAAEHGFASSVTLTSFTPSGGRHLVYSMPTGEPLGNTVGKLAPGVDTRGDGGYIVAPPSKTADAIYSWQDETVPVAPCPPGLALLLQVEESHPWEESRITLATMIATAPPPTVWLVDRIVEAGTLSVWYGSPGSMKSMLLADMAICIAAGIPWLGGIPGAEVAPRAVSQTAVLWIDVDNGLAVSHRRFAALAKSRSLSTGSITLHCFPPLDLCDPYAVQEFRDIILEENAGLVVVDTLLNATTVTSENDSAQMRGPMFALRRLVDQTGASIAVLHHPNKGGSKDGNGDIRGSGAIAGAVDSTFRVVRPDIKSGEITIAPTKTRNSPVQPFAALWEYSHDQQGELESGRFFGRDCEPQTTPGQQDLRKKIRDAIANGPLGVNQILKKVGGSKARLVACLHDMEEDEELVSTPGPGNRIIFSRPE